MKSKFLQTGSKVILYVLVALLLGMFLSVVLSNKAQAQTILQHNPNPVVGNHVFATFEDCQNAGLSKTLPGYVPQKDVGDEVRKKSGFKTTLLGEFADGDFKNGGCSKDADVTLAYKNKDFPWVYFSPSMPVGVKGLNAVMLKCLNIFGDSFKPVVKQIVLPKTEAPPVKTAEAQVDQKSVCDDSCMARVVETVTAKIQADLKITPVKIEGRLPVSVNITPDVTINYKDPTFTEGRPLKIVIPVGGGQVEQCINKCWTGLVAPGDRVVRVRWTNQSVSDGLLF
jgi:hypothetical protein